MESTLISYGPIPSRTEQRKYFLYFKSRTLHTAPSITDRLDVRTYVLWIGKLGLGVGAEQMSNKELPQFSPFSYLSLPFTFCCSC